MRGYYTVAEVAERAGTTPSAIRHMVRLDRIPGAERVGQQWFFDANVIDDWLPNRPRRGRPRRRAP